MRTYKVKSLAVCGKNNKIYRAGDEVTDKHFPEGNAAQLCKQGHLELISGDKISENESEMENGDLSETGNSNQNDPPPAEDQPIPYDDVTQEEMIKRLYDKNVSFNPGLGKKKMYKLYEETFEEKK